MMEIGDILREQDVVIRMPAKGKRSALTRIAAQLGNNVGKGVGEVLTALQRRERLGSTGIGHGVAVPHARIEGIAGPVAMMATLQEPVWFGSPDNDPVDLLLAFLWPSSDMAGFLPTLASFCRLLRQPELRARLRGSDSPAEARAWLAFFDEKGTRGPSQLGGEARQGALKPVMGIARQTVPCSV
ncbi:PTS sugar transporter subunit IIA [Manganibacter manganicus]|nr:PTS sugar transporter subunit IIA [Pseudaminobacter manganicus]